MMYNRHARHARTSDWEIRGVASPNRPSWRGTKPSPNYAGQGADVCVEATANLKLPAKRYLQLPPPGGVRLAVKRRGGFAAMLNVLGVPLVPRVALYVHTAAGIRRIPPRPTAAAATATHPGRYTLPSLTQLSEPGLNGFRWSLWAGGGASRR